MYAKQLREQMNKLATDMRALVNKAKGENNRGLTTEEAEQFDRMERDYSNLEANLARAEKMDNIEASLATVDPKAARIGTPQIAPPAEEGDAQAKAHALAFAKYVRLGIEGLDASERALMAAKHISNTMSTTTGSQGGYLVPQGFQGQLEEAQLWFGGIAGTVEEFATETGNPLPWPTDNDTSNTGEIIGQNTAVAAQDVAFNQIVLGSYIFSSKLVKVPLALIQDSFFDVNAYIARKLGTRLGRIKNTKYTVGSGTNEPTGIVTATVAAGNVLTAATGGSTSVTVDNLTDLEHSVDPNYRNLPSSKYMFNDSTLKALKKLKDSANRPLWQPALTASFGQGAQPTINDHGYVINNDMATMAANAYSILFGDMSKFKVRKVAGGTSLLRLVERYAEFLQVGFLAFERGDSNLLDAGTHPIAVFRNSAT